MNTRTCNASAPLMPAIWPVRRKEESPVKRRFPNTVDEPLRIGCYLEPLVGISTHSDKERLLREYLKEFIH